MPASNQIFFDFSLVGDSLLNNDAQDRKMVRALTWYDPFPELDFARNGIYTRFNWLMKKPAYCITATSADGIHLQCRMIFIQG